MVRRTTSRGERFALRRFGIAHFQTWSPDETLARISEAHVLVMSGFWSDELLARAGNARFIQVCAADYDRFDLDVLRERGLRLAKRGGHSHQERPPPPTRR